MHRHLFALAWADARDTGDAEEKAVTFRLRAKAFDCIHPPAPSRGRRKAEGIYIHPHSPPQGGREKEGFPQGFVEHLSLLLPVCLVMLRGKPLIMSIGSFPHKAETLIVFTPHSLSRCVRVWAPQGAQGVWGRVCLTVWGRCWSGFLVCVFTYHFGMLVVGCVCNPFFLSLANQGAYFNSMLNMFY